MSVDVSIGDGLIAKTDYAFWTWTDAVNNVVITAADPTNPRIDAIAAYVDLAVVSSASNNNPGALKFIAVAGTPAGSPVIPNDAAIQAAVGASNPFIKLASVAVAALASNIVNANITDLRTDITYRGSVATSSWTPVNSGLPTATVYNGNRSYTHTYSSSILGYKTLGMRNKYVRTVTAPIQCTSLNGTTQYYSKSSPNKLTATDDITVMGWIKPNAYATSGIASRQNGSTDGWLCYLSSDGRLNIKGARAADDAAVSYQSVALNKWVHVAATLDSSGAVSTMYIDGVSVPVAYTNNANSAFLAPTQSLLIGATDGAAPASFFPGKIAQIAIFDAVLSAATIRSYMSQGLAGNETNLKSAYSFSNSITDLNTTTPNDLTANGSAVATNADSPFAGGPVTETTLGTTEYSITTALSSDGLTETVQVAEGFAIPTSGAISSMAYSGQKLPYGFPAQRGKWRVQCLQLAVGTTGSIATTVIANPGSFQITAPIGDGILAYEVSTQGNPASGNNGNYSLGFSTANNTLSDTESNSAVNLAASGAIGSFGAPQFKTREVSLSVATIYYFNMRNDLAVNQNLIVNTGVSSSKIYWEPAHL